MYDMKKKKLFLLILLFMLTILIFLSILFATKNKLTSGYLLYIENEQTKNQSVSVLDIKNQKIESHSIPNYSNICLLGTYYDGDFCCVGYSDSNNATDVILIKNKKIEQIVTLPQQPLQIASSRDFVYFADSNTIFKIDRNTKHCEQIISDIYINADSQNIFFLSSTESIAFLRQQNSPNLSLCIYESGVEQTLGTVIEVFGWNSADELLVLSNNNTNKNMLFNVQTQKNHWIRKLYFGNYFGESVISSNLDKMACYIPTSEPNWCAFGAVDLYTGFSYKYIFGKNIDFYLNPPKSILWIDN